MSKTFFATVPKGIEPVCARELELLGAHNVRPGFGGVHFDGDLRILYRANLELRTATRVLMPMREFSAKTPEMLYDQARRIKWEQLLNPDMTFAVDCTISGSKSLGRDRDLRSETGERRFDRDRRDSDRPPARGMNHSQYVALKLKDAIVDQLRLKQGARPNVDRDRPDVQINAYIHEGRCTLSIDASNGTLHERGYRESGARAPLKENLAAAIVLMTEWDGSTPWLDPMCGSGTLEIEAALVSMKIAPGLLRERFGFMGWQDFDRTIWTEELDRARSAAKYKPSAPIVGTDQSRSAVTAALANAQRAGLSKFIHFERKDLESAEPIGGTPGVFVVNPPYGERLGEVEELKDLYKRLGDLLKQRFKGWTGYIFTGNPQLVKSVGLRTARRFELFNGPIECRLLKYELY